MFSLINLDEIVRICTFLMIHCKLITLCDSTASFDSSSCLDV